jgi:hypothetical protein
MKVIFPTVIIAAFSMLLQSTGFAQQAEGAITLAIHADKRCLDKEKTASTSTTTTKEQWVYEVVIKNNSFRDLQGLTVQYREYMKDDSVSTKSTKIPLRKKEGTASIDTLANLAEFKFQTEVMEIESSLLKSGWTYKDRSNKRKTKDSLYGIWVRVMKDDKMVAEYVNPPMIKEKEKWQDE